MVRRKGERPVEKVRQPWSDRHPVANRIATGDNWFDAWIAERSTPYVRLSRSTGIPVDRLMDIGGGSLFGRNEAKLLADAWHADVADIVASLPDPSLLID